MRQDASFLMVLIFSALLAISMVAAPLLRLFYGS
ncbi:hypothetical protein ShzoTeo12_11610 [Shinella zoogloeoides]|nr:hypothetical protein ShzoTeo12_11610 [Shinella zoogloeoides]